MANCIKCGRNLPGLSFGKKLCSWCVQYEKVKAGVDPDDGVQRVETPPWLRRQSTSMIVTQAFFGINVAVFLGMLFAGVSMLDNPSGRDLVHWGANFGPYTLSGQYWRLLTCVFVHGSLIHIALNMWCLWNLGTLAESLYGHWTFAVVYLLAGIGGSVGSIVWNPEVLSVGASGAIFGVAGAVIASVYLGEFSLPRGALAGTLRSVVMFVGYNLVFGAMVARVDNAAHIGGLITGLLLGALIAKGAPDPDNFGQRLAVLALGLLLLGGGVAWWLHSRDYLRHMQRGNGFMSEAKTDLAIAEFQTVVHARPDYAPGHYALGRAYAVKRDFAGAETELKRAVELNPGSENYYYSLGFDYVDEKKLPQAREAFQRMLSVNSNSGDAHFGLAAVDMEEQKYQDAIQEFQTATRLDPDLEGAHAGEGRAQMRLGRTDDAIASFKKELETVGDDYDTEISLASAYDAKEMKKEAAEAREKAAALTGQH